MKKRIISKTCLLFLGLLSFNGIGCSSPLRYAEKWSGIKFTDELKEVVVFNEGLFESYVVIHGLCNETNYQDFVARHGLKKNRSEVDYIERKYKSFEDIKRKYRKSTSPRNIFYKVSHHEEAKVVVEIYLDSDNGSIWVTVASI